MPDIKLTVTGLDEAMRLLNLQLQQAAQTIGVAVAEATRNEVSPYPGARRARQPFQSDKSRRYFFAALRSGAITVPYRRDGLIGRSWQVWPTGTGAELTNNARGVDWVHSATWQAWYHKGNWETDEAAARRVEDSGLPERIATDVVNDLIRKAGG